MDSTGEIHAIIYIIRVLKNGYKTNLHKYRNSIVENINKFRRGIINGKTFCENISHILASTESLWIDFFKQERVINLFVNHGIEFQKSFEEGIDLNKIIKKQRSRGQIQHTKNALKIEFMSRDTLRTLRNMDKAVYGYFDSFFQVIEVHNSERNTIVIRVWDGFEHTLVEKLFSLSYRDSKERLTPKSIYSVVPRNYYVDLLVYGNFARYARSLMPGDIIRVVNIHLASSTPNTFNCTLHEGGSKFNRGIYFVSPETIEYNEIEARCIRSLQEFLFSSDSFELDCFATGLTDDQLSPMSPQNMLNETTDSFNMTIETNPLIQFTSSWFNKENLRDECANRIDLPSRETPQSVSIPDRQSVTVLENESQRTKQRISPARHLNKVQSQNPTVSSKRNTINCPRQKENDSDNCEITWPRLQMAEPRPICPIKLPLYEWILFNRRKTPENVNPRVTNNSVNSQSKTTTGARNVPENLIASTNQLLNAKNQSSNNQKESSQQRNQHETHKNLSSIDKSNGNRVVRFETSERSNNEKVTRTISNRTVELLDACVIIDPVQLTSTPCNGHTTREAMRKCFPTPSSNHNTPKISKVATNKITTIPETESIVTIESEIRHLDESSIEEIHIEESDSSRASTSIVLTNKRQIANDNKEKELLLPPPPPPPPTRRQMKRTLDIDSNGQHVPPEAKRSTVQAEPRLQSLTHEHNKKIIIPEPTQDPPPPPPRVRRNTQRISIAEPRSQNVRVSSRKKNAPPSYKDP